MTIKQQEVRMSNVEWKTVYKRNEDIVSREIENEFILVPVTSGIGDLDEEIYALNETGRLIWEKLDGVKDLTAVKNEILHEFEVSDKELVKDISGFVHELVKRNILLKVS